jgi:hypothetical protein
MSDFIGECRREWKLLGVPDQVADEMAAELGADLQAAEADGATIEDVLGARASTPREFAAEWAAERGVTERRPPSARGRWRSAIPSAIAAFAAVAISGAVIAIVAAPSSPKRLSLPAPPGVWSLADVRATQRVYVGPPLRIIEQPMQVPAQEATPGTIWVGPLPPNAAATAQLGAVEIRIPGDHDDARTVGWVLLIVGLTGMLLLLLWLAIAGPFARRLHRAKLAL